MLLISGAWREAGPELPWEPSLPARKRLSIRRGGRAAWFVG